MKKVAGGHDGIWNKKIRNQNHFYPNLARSPISITNRDALKSFANSLSFGDRLNNSDLHYADLSNKRAAALLPPPDEAVMPSSDKYFQLYLHVAAHRMHD